VPKIGDCMNDCEIVAKLCGENVKKSEITQMISFVDNAKNNIEYKAKYCSIPNVSTDIINLYMNNCISRSSVILANRTAELKKSKI
jgi:hypothetical protein